MIDPLAIVEVRILAGRITLRRQACLEVAEVGLVNVTIMVEVAADRYRTTPPVDRGAGDGIRAVIAGITHAITIGVLLGGIGLRLARRAP